MTIQELEKIMQEHGIVLRAIPMKTRGIYETYHKELYSDGKIEYLEPFGREMLVVESIPRHAGKFCIQSTTDTMSTIRFANEFYDSIESAVESVLRKDNEYGTANNV